MYNGPIEIGGQFKLRDRPAYSWGWQTKIVEVTSIDITKHWRVIFAKRIDGQPGTVRMPENVFRKHCKPL